MSMQKKPFPTPRRSKKQDIRREIWALVDKSYVAKSPVLDEAWRAYYFKQRKINDTLQTPKKTIEHCQHLNQKKHLSYFAYWMKKHLHDEMLEFYGDFIGLELVISDVVDVGGSIFFTVRVQQKDDFPTEEDLIPEHTLRRT